MTILANGVDVKMVHYSAVTYLAEGIAVRAGIQIMRKHYAFLVIVSGTRAR